MAKVGPLSAGVPAPVPLPPPLPPTAVATPTTVGTDSTQIPLVFDKEGFHSARGKGREVNFLYGDDHVKNLLTLEGAIPPK